MTIQTKLDTAFADLNKLMLDRQMAWAKDRKDAMTAVQQDYVSRKDYRGITEAKIAAAGGKSWYEIFNGRSWNDIAPLIEKNVAMIIAKRDANIINALAKKGVYEIGDFDLVHTSDGYEGHFQVDGHNITIRTILAGGYNIQCLHQRTLVKVR